MRCVSFCPTESYSLNKISVFFRSLGYIVKQYRKVLHLSYPAKNHDIFVFAYGCFVAWGMNSKEKRVLLEQLKPFSINPLTTIEANKFVYRYGIRTEITSHERFNIDIITLESDSPQLKLALAYGLAQSIQLESYESALQKTIDYNSHYPQQIAAKGRISLSQKEISKKMGQIFLARSHVNLNSEYLAAPEYFWEHPNFEGCYNISKKFLDISSRVEALNQKLDVLHELFDMLNSQLQYRHANLLEMVIILLIFIEIVISLAEKFI